MQPFDADVGVIGVGTMGAMSAWRIALTGASVLGFEQYSPGHDRSAVGGESRIFRTAYHEGSSYSPILLRALDMWRQLEAETNRTLLTLCGGLSIGPRQHGLVHDVLESAERSGIPFELLQAEEMAVRYPQHRLLPGEVGVLDRASGVLRPEFAVLSAVQRAESLGACILGGHVVDDIVPAADHVRISSRGRHWRVRQAVITTGPWLRRLVPSFAANVSIKKLVMTWYMARDLPEFQAGRFPIFIRESGAAHIFGIPSLDGGSVKISAVGDYGDVADPDRLDHGISVDEVHEVTDAVRRFLPGLVPAPVRISTYMDGFTPDGHALVGQLPGTDNVWVMGGFSGHGFKMSPVIGQAAADLVSTGITDIPIAHLDPRRYPATAPLTQTGP